MSISTRRIKSDGTRLWFTAAKAMPEPPETEGPFFALIRRFRGVVLTSPLWLAALMIGLNTFGGQRIHAVIDFLTGISGQ